MHYKGFLITKELPSEDKISQLLEPYYYENNNNKWSWDWYQVGGRYGGGIKIKFNPQANELGYALFKERNNKFFISNILETIKEHYRNDNFFEELDFLQYMGLKENTLFVDGGYTNDLINFDITNCYLVIEDDNIITRDEELEFDSEVKEKIDLKDKFITIIDFHD